MPGRIRHEGVRADNDAEPAITPTPAGWRRWRWLVGGAAVLLLTAPAAIATAGTGTEPSPALQWSNDCGFGDRNPADYTCGTLTVPVDYANPGGAKFQLAVSKLSSAAPGKRRGIMMMNPGGPGLPGRDMPLDMRSELSSSVVEQYDLIGFDVRRVDCGGTVDEPPPQYRPETFDATVAAARKAAQNCATNGGAAIAHVTSRDTARDMDALRAALGEQKINFYGVSYGTYLGAVYLQMFPNRADRFVLDSNVDPASAWRGTLQAKAIGSKPAFERWTRLAAADDATYHLGATADAVAKTFWDLVARADKTTIQLPDGLTYTGDQIREQSRARVFANKDQSQFVASLKAAAADGKPASTAAVARIRTLADSDEPGDPVQTAIHCNEGAAWPRDPEVYRREAIRDKKLYPLGGDSMSNITACAFWSVPRAEKAVAVRSTVPVLLTQNEWDSQTPLFLGQGMKRALTGSRMVVVKDGEGHGILGTNSCADDAVNRYFGTGELPRTDLTCQAGT
jgi:pimeloyl-ACP methyl ester carboxylesterase